MGRDFNGSSLGYQAGLNLTAYSTLSLSAWINFDAVPGSGQFAVVFELGPLADANSEFAVYLGGSGGVGLVTYHVGDVGQNEARYNLPATGSWNHHLFTYDFTLSTEEVNYYLNGSLQTANTRPFNANNSSSATFANDTFNVACRNGSTLFTDCKMADLAIYNGDIGAVGAAELAKGYSAELVRRDKLIHWWPYFGRGDSELGAVGQSTMFNVGVTTPYTDSPPLMYEEEVQYRGKTTAAFDPALFQHRMQARMERGPHKVTSY